MDRLEYSSRNSSTLARDSHMDPGGKCNVISINATMWISNGPKKIITLVQKLLNDA